MAPLPPRVFWLAAAAVVAADQLTKLLAVRSLPPGEAVPVLPGVLWLRLVHNPGIAFGQLAGAGLLLVAAGIAGMVGVLLYRRRVRRDPPPRPALVEVALALALGGAAGNLLDRIRLGKVVDFVDLGWWPVFNLADSALTVAVALLFYCFALAERSTRPASAAAEAGDAAPREAAEQLHRAREVSGG